MKNEIIPLDKKRETDFASDFYYFRKWEQDVKQALRNFIEELKNEIYNSGATDENILKHHFEKIIEKAKLKHFGEGLI